MKEEFLHFIWKYKLYNNKDLKTCKNDTLEILNPGICNFDSGPDFFNAKIKINDTIWAGNVELHVNSSDWYAHNHHKNKAYDSVVLQVVYKHDKEVKRTSGENIPTFELDFEQSLLMNYEKLVKSKTWIACENNIKKVDFFIKDSWMAKLAVERLEDKSDKIGFLLNQINNSWETAFYILLARNFGFKLNSEPFELLAKSLPLNYLAKHKNSLFQVESLLFGQAGFLNEENGDEYYLNLKKEYKYLQKKFSLKPLEKHLWKFLRSRPVNFPTIRIAQFAMLIYKSSGLFSKIVETELLKDLYGLFELYPSEYWNNHYVFNKESGEKRKILGRSAIDILLINSVIPFLFVYGKAKGNYLLQDRAISFLEKIKAEKNSIIDKWTDLGMKALSAFDSQALIQLKNEYCNAKKCLYCHIGNKIIKDTE